MRLVFVPVAVFALLAALFVFGLRSGDPTRLPSMLIGRAAPALDLPALEGLTDGGKPVPGIPADRPQPGEVTVVNFWASWCGPCLQEHPQLMALKALPDVRLYGINYKDQPANARRFLGARGNPFAAVGVDANGRTGIEWGVIAVPETFVVDSRGIVVFKHTGPISAEALQTTVIPAIRAAQDRAVLAR